MSMSLTRHPGTRAANMLKRVGLELSLELRQAAIAKVRQTTELGNKVLRLVPPMPVPDVDFNLTGGTAGVARRGATTRLVSLNPALLVKHQQRTLDQTIPHEVAHLFVNFIHKNTVELRRTKTGRVRRHHTIDAHGLEWQHVMDALGVPSDRQHTMDVTDLKKNTKRVPYDCPQCQTRYNLSLKLHNRVLKGQHRICRHCRVRIVQAGDPVPRRPIGVPTTSTPTQSKWTPAPTQVHQRTSTKPQSKVDQARAIMKANMALSRKEMINRFVVTIGMSPAAASTYYQNIKNEIAKQ